MGILRELFNEILIPPAVYDEFLAFEQEGRLALLSDNPWIKVTPLENPVRVQIFAGLDRGEAEVLALAEEQNAQLILMDERRGRRYAQRLGLPLSGTLGVLLLAKEVGLNETVLPLVSAMQEIGLHFHSDLIAKALDLAGETV